MTHLSVNLNKVALLRNSRNFGIPSVIKAAYTCIQAGAHGITVHPRPDARHIKSEDVYEFAKMLTVEFNIESNPSSQFLEIIRDVKPTQCTLVPDGPDVFTSDHGWDLVTNGFRLLAKWIKGAYLSVGDIWLALILDQKVRESPIPEYTHIGLTVSIEDFPILSQRIQQSGAKNWQDNKSEGASLYFLDPK
ncbi:MAG: pyridoxine 5'-phosphate synthase [Nostoc sp.]|uniref:pyridoxine 5'-phosphate synthase n=1 Tax=Nostoc sp. TaxID=1180 RepID=UPI002FF8AA20